MWYLTIMLGDCGDLALSETDLRINYVNVSRTVRG